MFLFLISGSFLTIPVPLATVTEFSSVGELLIFSLFFKLENDKSSCPLI